MVFYCLFADNIWGFNMWFVIRCLGFYGCLCISYAPFLVLIVLIITPHSYIFMIIICNLLGLIPASNLFVDMFKFLTLFSPSLLLIWTSTVIYIRCYCPPGLNQSRTGTPTNLFFACWLSIPCNPLWTWKVLFTYRRLCRIHIIEQISVRPFIGIGPLTHARAAKYSHN